MASLFLSLYACVSVQVSALAHICDILYTYNSDVPTTDV